MRWWIGRRVLSLAGVVVISSRIWHEEDYKCSQGKYCEFDLELGALVRQYLGQTILKPNA